MQKPREIAVRVLEEYAHGQEFLEQIVERWLTRAELSAADRGLLHELCNGVARWQGTLDWLIRQRARNWPPKLRVQVLLRLGLYQIFWLDRIPDHAAVNETVTLAKRMQCLAQSGFINAVLRNSLRERKTIATQLLELKERNPATGYSHPPWLVERWEARWGREHTTRTLTWNNTPPPTFARLNRLRVDSEILVAQWGRENVHAVARQWDWTEPDVFYQLEGHPPLKGLTSVQHGWFYVQDPSTALAVMRLGAKPGEAVLDMCAAPGGKATYIAQHMRNEGRLVALEPDPGRRELLRQNCERLGATCVEIWEELGRPRKPFDRVLVDAPCSNTGVIRRRIDVRSRITVEEIARLTATQKDLLHRATEVLRPGGTLVYSTCSLEREENEQLVKVFLAEHPKFRLLEERTLLPFKDGVDGAYVARLEAAGPG